MNLARVEKELKKRWPYDYRWGRIQSDDWDAKTRFIYHTYSFAKLLEICAPFPEDLKNYALNRWYNFWSAMAVEYIFCSHKQVMANRNKYDKLVDFRIEHLPFDHKTSVFPKGYNNSLSYAQKHPVDLLKWLYKNQSQEGRKHLNNRLFVVLYDEHRQKHWKMKAEISVLKNSIDNYLQQFSKDKLISFNAGDGMVFADIIWVMAGAKAKPKPYSL